MENILIPKTKQGTIPKPVENFQLTTKKFVVQLLQDILSNANSDDAELIIENALSNYV
jgi:hypothetical protein